MKIILIKHVNTILHYTKPIVDNVKKILIILQFSIPSIILIYINIYHPAKTLSDTWWAKPGQKFFIETLTSCSVGFPAWDNQGTHYFITAGHCFRNHKGTHYRNETHIYDPNTHQNIGFERLWAKNLKNYIDISLVQLYPGKHLTSKGFNNIPTKPLTTYTGEKACIAGTRLLKKRCGTITIINSTVNNYTESSTIANYATYCSWRGDSGGAIYNNLGALGIESTLDLHYIHDEPCKHGRSSFIPITSALKWLQQTIPSLTIH